MDEKFIALTQEWHTKGWNNRQEEVDGLKAKNIRLTHALVNTNAEKSKWAKDYWQLVERNAEYGAMLMSNPDSLEFKCYQKEKQNEELTKQIRALTSQLNNMEACYIEKKKQVEAVSQVLCELKESMADFKEMDLYDKGYRVAAEYVIADLDKALRGAHD